MLKIQRLCKSSNSFYKLNISNRFHTITQRCDYLNAAKERRPHNDCIGFRNKNFSTMSAFTALSNSAPVLYFQDILIKIHDDLGLPWWGTIIFATFLLRTLITLPLTVYQHKITGRIENISTEMPAIIKELKLETVMAKRKFNLTDAQAMQLYSRSVKKQWDNLIIRDNCHPLKTLIVLWGQIPLWIIQSASLRNLVYMMPDPSQLDAQIIYGELSLGGFGWIPNLTLADTSYILPVTLGILNLVIIEIQLMSKNTEPTKWQNYATNFFRIISVLMVPIAASVPSSLSLYWTASSVYGLTQNLVLLSPTVKRITGMPITRNHLATPYQDLAKQSATRIHNIYQKISFLTTKN